ncbi:MAG: hypothetical protein HDQ87_03725 [Clostridia bacterium]|nr:hypothetical protein [Clostridia bacterium]
MRKIWQQDVLRYLTNRQQKKDVEDPGLPFGLLLPLKTVRLELGLGGDDSKLSNFVNRKKSTVYTCGFDAEEVFDTLIQPLLDEGRITADSALRSFHEFLWAEGIEDTWQDVPDYRTCIVEAFREGLQRLAPVEAPEPAALLRSQRLLPNAAFTGRGQDLAALGKMLEEQGTVILTGMGGMGKTSLAEEFARRNAGRYVARQIVTAEPGFRSFRELLLSVKFAGSESSAGGSPEGILQRQMDRLCALGSDSLLIFDNVDQDLEGYGLFRRLLRESGAHILVTTRMLEAFPEGTEMALEALAPSEQLELLARSMDRQIREAEMDAARQILARIGGHTLLIQLLGRAARRQSLSLDELLSRLQGLQGFAALESSVRIQKDDYNRNEQIREFIREVLFNLGPLSAPERELLRFLTLLPAEGISAELLKKEPFSLDKRSLRTLTDNSWLSVDAEGTLRMHPVIREAVMAELDVTSHSCTPFLYALDQALWEPEVSAEFLELLRLASAAIDMLFIRDELRSLLVSDRLNPVFKAVYDAAEGSSLWGRLEALLLEGSRDPEILPEVSDTLRMYAAFCGMNRILDQAGPDENDPAYAKPFLDMQQLLKEAEQRGDLGALESAAQTFMELFLSLRAGGAEEEGLLPEDPQARLLAATGLIGAELSEYLQEAGFIPGMDTDPDAVPSLFSLLSPDDMRLLETVSRPAYGSFLVTALEAFSASQAVLPFAASAAVFALTQLFTLQQLSAAQIRSLDEAAEQRGWTFPKLSYLPRGLGAPTSFTYGERLWGRPEAELSFANGRKDLLVSISRPNREEEMDPFDLLEPEEAVSETGRTVRVAESPGSSTPVVQADIGPWRVEIHGFRGISQKEALKVAEGLTL